MCMELQPNKDNEIKGLSLSSREMMAARRQRIAAAEFKAAQTSRKASEVAGMFIEFTLRREACLELAKQHGLVSKWGAVSELEESLSRLKQRSSKLQACFYDRGDLDTHTRADQIDSAARQGHSVLVSSGSRDRPNTNASNRATNVKAAAATAGRAGAPPPPPPPLPQALPGKLGLQQQQQQQQPRSAGGPAPPPPPPPLPQRGSPLLPDSTGRAPSAAPPAASHPQAAGLAAAAAAAAGLKQSGPRPGPPPPPPLPPSAGAMGMRATSKPAAGPGPRAPPPPPPFPGTAAGAVAQRAAGHSAAAAPTGINALAAAAAAAAGGPIPAAVSSSRSSTPWPQEQEGGASPGPGTPRAARAAGNGGSPSQVLLGDAAGGRLKTLHVDPVPVHKLAEGSFWKVAHPVAKPIQDSMEYLLRAMFSDRPRRRPKQSPRGSSGAGGGGGSDGPDGLSPVVTCVPEKRALQVEVVLKRLRMQPQLLAEAINQLNTDKLKADDLTSLRSILPKQEEISQVREAKQAAEKTMGTTAAASRSGPCTPAGSEPTASASSPSSAADYGGGLSPRLGVVEACFEALGSVELLPAKMRAMEFRYDLDAAAALVAEYAADLGRSLDALRVSGSLHYLLAFVRDVANTMNKEQRGALAGFKLESLARLQSTKMAGATDLNLLHYIVAHLSAVLPGVLVLDAEREAFRAACRRGTFDTVSGRIRTLQDTHKRLTADLAKAREVQHQRCEAQQQPPPPAAAAAAGAAPSTPVPRSIHQQAPDTPATTDSHDIYVSRLAALLEAATPRMMQLQQQLDDVITKFKWTAEYYCEDVDRHAWKQQPVAFLTHFLELLDGLVTTQKDTARLARVTSMLAEFVELQQHSQQQQALLEAGAHLLSVHGQEDGGSGDDAAGELDDVDLTADHTSSDLEDEEALVMQQQQQQEDVDEGPRSGKSMPGSAAHDIALSEEQLRHVTGQLLHKGVHDEQHQRQAHRAAVKPRVPLLPLGGHLQQPQQQADRQLDGHCSVTPVLRHARCEGVGCSRHRQAIEASSPSPSSNSASSHGAATAGVAKKAAGAAMAAPIKCRQQRAVQEPLSRSCDSGPAAAVPDVCEQGPGLQGQLAPGSDGSQRFSRQQHAVVAATAGQRHSALHQQHPQHRSRSVSPQRPVHVPHQGRHLLSPLAPSHHQQQRLEALRLRTRQSPKQEVLQQQEAHAGQAKAAEAPEGASPAAALLISLKLASRAAEPGTRSSHVSQQAAQLDSGGDAGLSEVSEVLTRLLFQSTDSIDLSASQVCRESQPGVAD